jgi:putative NADPH-quinone reductase
MPNPSTKKILIIDGHPDRDRARLVHGLAEAYGRAAEAAGHTVRTTSLCELDFPWLRSAAEFESAPPANIAAQQQNIRWADHLVLLYPLWLGSMPAVLKAFLEQVLRPGFAFGQASGRGLPKKLLAGKSARVVVTMGMPAFFYRLYYRAHSLKSLERNILSFVGIAPVRATVLGNVAGASAKTRAQWIAELEEHARRAR